jgi:hypothetical protein
MFESGMKKAILYSIVAKVVDELEITLDELIL